MPETKFPETMTCPKCKGAMKKGIIGPYRLAWKKGDTFFPPAGLIGGTVYTYKCKKCGYLESYEPVKA